MRSNIDKLTRSINSGQPGGRFPRTVQWLFAFATLLVASSLFAVLTSGVSAQATPCVEQPAFEFFDADEDGLLSVSELRAADPDNAELQQVADDLEAEGVPAIQYSGCDESVAGSDDGTQSGETGGSVQDGDSATPGVGAASTELPGVDEGSEETTGILMIASVAGGALILGVVAFVVLRQRRAA
jgi:hypothetical protein